MSVHVWPYHRAECDRCEWDGEWHLSPAAARREAEAHDKAHERVDHEAMEAFRAELRRL